MKRMRIRVCKKGAARHAMSLLAAFAALQLAACATVGPDYSAPSVTLPRAWNSKKALEISTDSLQDAIASHWWRTFQDPLLSALVEEAVHANLDVLQARARVREARARREASRAELFPSLDAGLSASRSSSSETAGGGGTRSFLSAAFDAGWEIDLFGGRRRSVEAAQADFEAQGEDLHDVLVTLSAELALNYLDTRIYQRRLAVAENNLAMQQESDALIASRHAAGLADELELQQSRADVENTRAQIPALHSALEEAKNRVAILTGALPGTLLGRLETPQPIPDAPLSVAIGVPADLLRRRPDIRRAERNLAAQTARIGTATAELYPRLSLAGSIGLESLQAGDLLRRASSLWNIGPSLTWNIFDAGALRAAIEVQDALAEQYLLAYQAAVLAAVEEVENGLTAFAEEQIRRRHLQAAVQAAQSAEKLADYQYQAGLVDFSTVLLARQSLLSLQDQLAQSDGAVAADLVRLYKAMGGGWRPETAGESQEVARKGERHE